MTRDAPPQALAARAQLQDPATESEALALFQALTPRQRQAILLATPDDTQGVAARRCGIVEETLSGWLNASHNSYSPAFKTLWYGRKDPANAIAYLERALENGAPKRLDQLARVADLLDGKRLDQLPERTLATAARVAERLLGLPLERHDKRVQAAQVDALTEVIARWAGRPREVEGLVLELEAETLETESGIGPP